MAKVRVKENSYSDDGGDLGWVAAEETSDESQDVAYRIVDRIMWSPHRRHFSQQSHASSPLPLREELRAFR